MMLGTVLAMTCMDSFCNKEDIVDHCFHIKEKLCMPVQLFVRLIHVPTLTETQTHVHASGQLTVHCTLWTVFK